MNDQPEESTAVKSQETLLTDNEKLIATNKNGRKLPGNGSRRSFIKRAGGLAAVAAMVPLQPLLGGKETLAEASDITYSEVNRANLAFAYRRQEAQAEHVSPPVAPDNGDFAKYTDHSGTTTWRS